MGLWNFMKNSGKSLFGGGDEATPDADTLKKEVQDLGLNAEGVEISVDGDKVTVTGDAVSQEEKEKIILAVGNVEGVAAVEDATAGTDDPNFYTVEKGDTLWGISTKTLGNGARYEEIFAANRPMLTHPDKIYPGQVLRIPQEKTA